MNYEKVIPVFNFNIRRFVDDKEELFKINNYLRRTNKIYLQVIQKKIYFSLFPQIFCLISVLLLTCISSFTSRGESGKQKLKQRTELIFQFKHPSRGMENYSFTGSRVGGRESSA